MKVTHSRLTHLLEYDDVSGKFTRKITASANALVGSVPGYINPEGYRQIGIDHKYYKAHRLAWFYVHKEWPIDQLDHINHKKDDNRIDNLREVSNQENHKNLGRRSDNISGCAGVGWYGRKNKWVARIQVGDKRICLGYFVDLAEAILAREAATIKYGFHKNHGKLAHEVTI